MTVDEAGLGPTLVTVNASPQAYLRARRVGLAAPILVLVLLGVGAPFMRLTQVPGGAVIGAAIVLTVGLGFAVILAVILRRAVVEVHARGIVLSGGFDRRAVPIDGIGSILLVTARYGTAERRELRVLGHQGQRLHSVMGDLFDPMHLKEALSQLAVPIDDKWDP